MSSLCGLMYYQLWPNTLQSGRWKVKQIFFGLSAGSCARFVKEIDGAKEKPKRLKHA